MIQGKRIEDAKAILKVIIRTREDGLPYVPLLRRLHAKLASLQDNSSLVAQLGAEMSLARTANARATKVSRKAAFSPPDRS